MTTLTLVHQKFFSSRRLSIPSTIDWVHTHERALSVTFLLGIALAVACYIGALYVTFGLSTVVSAQEVEIRGLADEVWEKEYQLEARTARIAEEHSEFFSTMERVSAIRYIGGGEGYAVNREGTIP